MHRMFSFLLAVAALAAPATAAAGLTTVGYEYRPSAALMADATSCDVGGGLTISLKVTCPDSNCDDARLVAKWRDAAGTLVAGPVLVGRMPWQEFASVHCSQRGTAVVLMPGAFRVVAPEGPLGPEQPLCPDGNCPDYGHTAAATDDGFFLAFTNRDSTDVLGRFVHEDGSADGPVLDVAEPAEGTGIRPWSPWFTSQLAAIGTGGDRVIVGWARELIDTYRVEVRSVLVDRSGTDGDEIRVSQYSMGEIREIQLHRGDDATSIAAWHHYNRLYPVARRVAPDDSLPSTTTTTTTLDPRVPEFFPSRSLGGLDDGHQWPLGRALAGSTRGRWFADWSAGASTSTDDARRWTSEPAGTIAATSGDGRWVRVSDGAYGEELALVASTSDDDGATWNEPFDLFRSDVAGATWRGQNHLELVAGADGHWVAAWYEYAQVWHEGEDGEWREDLPCGVRVAASSDRGATWQPVQTLATLDCYENVDAIALATDDAGNWVVAWSADTVAIARSNDGGATWSAPAQLELAPVASYPSNLDLAHDSSGKWLLVVQGVVQIVDEYAIGRLFLARSDDAGATWSEAAPLFPSHDSAFSGDFSPSLACEPGRCGLVWSSTEGADGGGLDSDLLTAFTTDAGSSWSAPRLLVQSARDDDFHDYTSRLVVTPAGTWGVLWHADIFGRPGEVHFTRSRDGCGDGAATGTEECDDGNAIEGDGCDSNCLQSGCGNVVVSPDEQCDDGNVDETDDCISDCRIAVCGDGFQRPESEMCDDGNDVATDACQSTCTPSLCGDGLVWEGVEECDVGPMATEYGACLPSCKLARCGDGFPREGVEECDDGNVANGDRCTRRCRVDRYCAFSPEGGGLTATQALSVLRKAVGRRVRCPLERCDLNHDGQVTSTDALRALRIAVGAVVADDCEEKTLTVRLESSELLGSIQVRVDYLEAEGDIGERADCTVHLREDVLWALNVDPGNGYMSAALVSLDGFRGPFDIVSCTWRGRPGTGTEKMKLTVADATDLDINPVPVQVGMRME